MKLYYILMAFAFVNVAFAFVNIWAKLREDHKKQVVITNNHIRSAFHQVDIAFMMAIIPESIHSYSIPQMQQHIKFQTDMQNEIFRATDLTVPRVRPNYNFDDDSYSDLKRDRRFMIKEATVYLILDNKSLPGPDFDETKFGDMCRLIGLFKSIINPVSYIISAVVDDSNNCTLTAIDNSVSEYRSIEGHVYQVDTDPHILLRSQALSIQYV
ncbi:uncharacterized protein LOC126832843 isoform X2 [Adelges cooleyi]|uniref:uncharacterized protein LOC126832843 isoform X2 n=1 Tax=Adelges cooleyi TaxID=133065 RepID=UPI00217FF067|nr:uncharacterized protein LOC126832843 isoform X2 [Adelges cooleyi]